MKPFTFVRIATITIAFAFAVGSLFPIAAQVDPARDILVYFVRGVERMPTGQPARVNDPVVQALLSRFNISAASVTSGFPNFREADTLMTTAEGRLIGMPNMAKIFRIRAPEALQRNQLVNALKELPGVLFAEPDGLAGVDVVPNDQYFSQQWSLQPGGGAGRIQAPEAWDIYTGSASTKIAIVDVGVDATHPDLSGKVSGHTAVYGYHGTHVAGIAAAKTNNFTGVAGVNWNAQIIAKAFNDGSASGDTYINQIVTEAVNEGSNVLNNSWKLLPVGRYSTTVRLAFAYAYKYNRVAVATIGNTGPIDNIVQYPGSFGQGIIAVGSTNSGDVVSNFSTRGSAIDVAAPGENIYSTYRNPDYVSQSGTSMAAPHVTGIVSLLKGYNANLFNDDIENIIQLSADKVYGMGEQDWTSGYGYGRVNAKKALDRLGSSYSLTQSFVVGGTDQGASSGYWMSIYGAQAVGLSDGTYWVKRHEVLQAVSYPSTPNVAVWGRGVATNGWADEGSVNFTYGFCEPVPGTVTSTSATLRTYAYEVFAYPAGQFLGWYPTPANNVRFEYTVHGSNPLSVSISGPSSLGWKQIGTWTANVSGGAGPVTYQWYKSFNGGSTWQTLGTSSTQTITMLDQSFLLRCDVHDTLTGQNASSTYYVEYGFAKAYAGLEPRPTSYALHEGYPNPFNPSTQIKFDLPEAAMVSLIVYDALGRKVTELANGYREAGYHSATWDASGVASGVYFARFTASDAQGQVKLARISKLLLMK